LTFFSLRDTIIVLRKNFMVEIGKRLKALRVALDLNQGEFAKRIELSQGVLSEIENGLKPLIDRNLKLICLEFRVNKDWLLTGRGEMLSRPPEPLSTMPADSAATPIIVEGRELTPDAVELLVLYDQLESPETRKDVRDYTQEKLELQELRKQTKAEKGDRRADISKESG
jgi:transcriptional regulator with XRE-family HTH domain